MTDPTQPQSAGQGDALRVLARLVEDQRVSNDCRPGEIACLHHGFTLPCPVAEARALLAEPAAVGAGDDAEIRLEAAVRESHALFHAMLGGSARDFRECEQPSCRIASGRMPVPPSLLERIKAERLPAPAGGVGGSEDDVLKDFVEPNPVVSRADSLQHPR